MSVSFAPTRLALPEGWEALLHDFSREVLRDQPADTYAYAAKYFKNEYIKRAATTGHDDDGQQLTYSEEAGGVDDAEIDLEDPALEQAAVNIQSAYRGYSTRKSLAQHRQRASFEAEFDASDPELNVAASKIQAGFRGAQGRKQVRELKQLKEDQEAIADINLDDPEVQGAAVKIQAGFRGHQARKEVAIRRESVALVSADNKSSEATEPTAVANDGGGEPKATEEAIDIDLNDPEVEAAANKIQAGFRGHKARQEVKQMRESLPQSSAEEVVQDVEPAEAATQDTAEATAQDTAEATAQDTDAISSTDAKPEDSSKDSTAQDLAPTEDTLANAGKMTYFAGLRSRGEPTQMIAAYKAGIKLEVELIDFEEWGKRKGTIAPYMPYITNPDDSIMIDTTKICKHLATLNGNWIMDEKTEQLCELANDAPLQLADPQLNLPDGGASLGCPPYEEWKAQAIATLKDKMLPQLIGPFFAGDEPGYGEAFAWHNLNNLFALCKDEVATAVGEDDMAKLQSFYDTFAELPGIKEYLASRPEQYGVPGSKLNPSMPDEAAATQETEDVQDQPVSEDPADEE